MTLTVFIALSLVGCGFMLYVLVQWIRDTQRKNSTGGCEGTEGDRKQSHVVTFSKTSRNKVNVPPAIDNQLLDIGQGANGSNQASTIQNGLPTSESLDP